MTSWIGWLLNVSIDNDYATGSIWNRYGNVLAFEINSLSREVLIKTKDIVQSLGYELIYADTDSVFIKRTESAIKGLLEMICANNLIKLA